MPLPRLSGAFTRITPSPEGMDVSLLFEELTSMGQLVGWVWYSGKITKPRRTMLSRLM